MAQLSGLDAACLHIETPNTPMNVVAVVCVDTSQKAFALERFLAHLESRVLELPPLRRRLVDSVLGLDRPKWVESREVRLDHHVRVVSIPEPGGDREFAALVADQASQPLDRSQPLWRLVIAEGLRHEQVGLVMVIHHAVADGVSGAALLAKLLDGPEEAASRDHKPVSHAESRQSTDAGEQAPPRSRASRIRNAAQQTVAAAEKFSQFALGEGQSMIDRALFAPENRLCGTIGPERIVAWSRTQRATLERIRERLGGTLNDVVLAACTDSLRHYLLAHNELPEVPLRAAVPISVRGAEGDLALGNRISAMLVRLPVQIEDPAEQLATLQFESRRAKQVHDNLGPETLGHLAELTSDGILPAAIALADQVAPTGWLPPIANLAISNVPGPQKPLYAAGCRVLAAHPHGPLLASIRLNITVMTYVDSVDFGLLACRQSLPDAEKIASGFGNAISDLSKIAGDEGR